MDAEVNEFGDSPVAVNEFGDEEYVEPSVNVGGSITTTLTAPAVDPRLAKAKAEVAQGAADAASANQTYNNLTNLQRLVQLGDIFGAINTLGRAARGAVVDAANLPNQIAIGASPVRNTLASVAGQPLPSEYRMGPVGKGLADAAGGAPMIAAGVGLSAAGVPPPVAFGSLMGGTTYEQTRDVGEAAKQAAIGMVLPGVNQAGKAAAAAALGAATKRGLLDASSTLTQKAVESLSGQGAMQLFMEGMDLPEYLAAKPEERKELLLRHIAANTALMGMEIPDLVSGTASETQKKLVADVFDGIAKDPKALDALRQAADQHAEQAASSGVNEFGDAPVEESAATAGGAPSTPNEFGDLPVTEPVDNPAPPEESNPDEDTSTARGGAAENPLTTAADDVGRGAGAIQAQLPGVSDVDAGVEALLDHAAANGKLNNLRIPTGFDAKGREHTVWFNPDDGRTYKATFPDQFGVDAQGNPTTPQRYLERLRLANEVFGDDIRLEGVVRDQGKTRVVTSQPTAKGIVPTEPEVRQFLTNQGFQEGEWNQQPAWYRAADNKLLTDAYPRNFSKTDAGMVPLDVQVAEAPAELRQAFAGGQTNPNVQTSGTSTSPLDNLKIDTDGKMFDAVMGIPIAAWNGSVDAVRLAVQGGRNLQQAVDQGIRYLRTNHAGVQFDEDQYRAMMSRDLVQAINQPSPIEDLRQAMAATPNQNQSVLERLRFAQKLADGLADGGDLIQRQMNRIRATSAQLYDALTKLPRYDDFQKAVGNWTGADQTTSRDIQQFVKQMNRAVKDPLRREAMTNWIQADGDLKLLAQREAASKGRVKRGYEMAQKLTPEEQGYARKIGDYLDEKLKQGIAADLLEHGVENYVTQVWKRENPITNSLRASLDTSRLPVDFNSARQRIFSSYFEGEQAGYQPANKDVGHLIALYDQSFNRSLSARGLIKQLTEGKASDGRPLTTVFGSGVVLPAGEGANEAILVKPQTRGEATADYKTIDHPALRGWKWVAADGNGAPVLVKGQLAVHPEVYQHLKNVLSTSALRRNPILRAILNIQSAAKQTTFSLSPFHQVQEGTHALGHGVNPLNTTELNFRDPAQRELINHGLQVAAYDAQQHFIDGMAGGGPIIGRIPLLGKAQQAYTEWLFQEHIPRLKMTMALDAMDRNVKRYAGELKSGAITRDQVAALTARQANAAFGDLNYKMMKYGSNPTFRDVMRLFLIAPDFLEARGRFVIQAAKPYGGEQLKALGLIAATSYLTARVLNQLLDGDPHFEAPFGVVINKRLWSMRTVPSDIEEAFTDIRRFSSNRLSPLVGRGLIEFFTGRDYRGAQVDGAQQLKDLLSSYVPMSIRTKDDEALWQKALSAAGLRNKPYNATMQIRDLATKFNQGSTEKAGTEVVSESIYRPLRVALETNDRQQILREYLELLKYRKASQIQTTFERMATAPFAGSRAKETQFRASLPLDKQFLYDQARAEQKQLYQTFKSTVGGR